MRCFSPSDNTSFVKLSYAFANNVDFRTFDCHRYFGIKNFQLASVILPYRLFGRFRKVCFFGNKGQYNTFNFKFWIDLALYFIDCFRRLCHTFKRQIVSLNGNDHTVYRRGCIEGCHNEAGHTVDQHIIILFLYLFNVS